jgi:hypothetical protein
MDPVKEGLGENGETTQKDLQVVPGNGVGVASDGYEGERHRGRMFMGGWRLGHHGLEVAMRWYRLWPRRS